MLYASQPDGLYCEGLLLVTFAGMAAGRLPDPQMDKSLRQGVASRDDSSSRA